MKRGWIIMALSLSAASFVVLVWGFDIYQREEAEPDQVEQQEAEPVENDDVTSDTLVKSARLNGYLKTLNAAMRVTIEVCLEHGELSGHCDGALTVLNRIKAKKETLHE